MFTILKQNDEGWLDFYIASIGPLTCYMIDKRSGQNGGIVPAFTLNNRLIMTQDYLERERILEFGGDVRETSDWRVYGIG